MRHSADADPTAPESTKLLAAANEMAARRPEVKLIYLFGSRVAGHTGPLSDYDLGVYVNRTTEAGQRDSTGSSYAMDVDRLHSELHGIASRALPGERVDLVILNGVPVPLAYHVVSTGRLLFERSTADRVEYEAYVMSLYGDYLPVLRHQKDELLNDGGGQRRIQRYREALGRTERALGSPDRDR